jgi:isoleucyl-tRNA synthetase
VNAKSPEGAAQRALAISIPPHYDWKAVEETVRKFWADIDIRGRIRRRLAGRRLLGYVEGPPTLNGRPHMGHIRGRIMKDLWYRYSTLKGENILFRAGWDCQGLPVELEAEAELGLRGSKFENLQRVGMEALVQACKSLLAKYEVVWRQADHLLGLLIDHDNAYYTYKDEYIEREWRYLERAWERGLLGEGYRVVAYCPSCQTSLSQAEVALGYESLEDPSVYYKVRLEDGTYALVWTTMPFTLVTDEMIAVHPEADYVVVEVGGERWLMASARLHELAGELGLGDVRVLRRVKGRELEGLRYEHPFIDLVPGLGRISGTGLVHRVVAEEFVDIGTGSGIVHLAPANGEEDFEVAQKRGVPIFAPFDDRAYFTDEAGVFAGRFARDADRMVIDLLRERGVLVKAGVLVHEYPTCWRSHHRLIWLARREYFYWVDRFKEDLLRAAGEVEYFFEPPRNRFLEFIRQAKPWCISRERVWGTPLPIWVCERCGRKTPAFSRRRILELALELPDGPGFELHRPWIDRVILRCPECGGRAVREPFVLDTWHNSGAAPYASMTDEEYESLVPVAFLTEGIDQTRGWAYTLLILGVLMSGRAPYRAFLFQGLVLDEQGRKMSKSLGNVVDGLTFLSEDSVDLARLYLMWKAAPIDDISLSRGEMRGRPYQLLNTLYHLHLYLVQNASLDSFDPRTHTVEWAEGRGLLMPPERWLLAKLARLVDLAEKGYSSANYHNVCREVDHFVIETVSQAYVPMVRQELWDDSEEGRPRRLSIYAALAYALGTVDRVLHPVAPYLTEYLYQTCLSGSPWAEPLLLEGWPQAWLPRAAGDWEHAVDSALLVQAATNSARMKAGVKRRWPLRTLHVLSSGERWKALSQVTDLIRTLCNVKEVRLHSGVEGLPARLSLRASMGGLGPLFRAEAGRLAQLVNQVTGDRAWEAYLRGVLEVEMDGRVAVIPGTAYELHVEVDPGLAYSLKEDVLVVLDVRRDEALVAEGLLRDLARRLQALRKERGYNPALVLEEACVAGLDDELLRTLEPYKSQLAYLVRVKQVRLARERWSGPSWREAEMDGHKIFIDVH